jgi:sigma-B regulation protein RsbU (phosphoserine phosphatase)
MMDVAQGKSQSLANLPFLAGAGPDALRRLAEVAVESDHQPGEIILEEGSTGCEVYLILEGLVEVVKGEGAEQMVLARLGTGELFGEMAFIEVQPRFATIRALEPTRLLELPEAAMRSLLAEEPHLLYRTVQVLSAKLRESDLQMIADLQRKNEELARAYRELQEAQAALVEKERLERELELAREIQRSILPQELPCRPGFECAARYRPARQVGGDFYDVIPLAEERVGLVMADVSDKGIAAALFMALTRSLIRAEARRSPLPQQVLTDVHKLLLEISEANMFVTVFYGVLDLAEGTLRYVRAGHDRPLLLSPASGACRFLEGDGMFLGVVESLTLEEVHMDLQPGDLLVLYTDGITDAHAPSGELFGAGRLQRAVCAAGRASAQDVCDFVFERVEQFQAGAVQYDDMALLVAGVKGRLR